MVQILQKAQCVLQGEYICRACSNCGLLSSRTGTFSDGSGTQNYAADSSCEWIIATSAGELTRITFTDFDTDSGYDVVSVSESADLQCKAIKQLALLSGSSAGSFSSATGYLHVSFSSDESTQYHGFTAVWGPEPVRLPPFISILFIFHLISVLFISMQANLFPRKTLVAFQHFLHTATYSKPYTTTKKSSYASAHTSKFFKDVSKICCTSN